MSNDLASWIAARITGEYMLGKVTRAFAHPAHDEIARLAYALYIEGGGCDGHDVAHWLRAERALRASTPQPLADRQAVIQITGC